MILAADFVVHEPWLRTKYRDYGEFLRERLALAGTRRLTTSRRSAAAGKCALP